MGRTTFIHTYPSAHCLSLPTIIYTYVFYYLQLVVDSEEWNTWSPLMYYEVHRAPWSLENVSNIRLWHRIKKGAPWWRSTLRCTSWHKKKYEDPICTKGRKWKGDESTFWGLFVYGENLHGKKYYFRAADSLAGTVAVVVSAKCNLLTLYLSWCIVG